MEILSIHYNFKYYSSDWIENCAAAAAENKNSFKVFPLRV